MSTYNMLIEKGKKKSIIGALLALLTLLSCGNRVEKGVEGNQLTFSMDTVIVDSKGEFLFLNWGMSTACISEDGKTLFNFNIQEPSLETIDLDRLELVNIQSFDKEGPNGVGNKGRGGIVHLGGDRIHFKGWPSPDIFTTKGEKLPNLSGLYGIKAKATENGKDFMYEAVNAADPQFVYGIINENSVKNFEFGKLNLLDSSLQTYALPTWEKFDAFTITYDDGNTTDIWGPLVYVVNIQQQIIVSSNISSELYVYKPDSDSLHHFTYSYNLTRSEKSGGYPTEISDPKEFHNIFKSIYGDVSFLPPIWDPEGQQFYRIHYETLYEDEFSGMYPERLGADVYLSIYDENFQLMDEVQLPQFQEIPSFHFAKDGKIWIFQNIDDEMGFIRFTLE